MLLTGVERKDLKEIRKESEEMRKMVSIIEEYEKNGKIFGYYDKKKAEEKVLLGTLEEYREDGLIQGRNEGIIQGRNEGIISERQNM